MIPVVALTYFLCSQKKSLFRIEESKDPELRRIYQITARSFEPCSTKEEENYNHMMDIMENTNNQFQKTSKCADELKKIMSFLKKSSDMLKMASSIRARKKKSNWLKTMKLGRLPPIERLMSANLYFTTK